MSAVAVFPSRSQGGPVPRGPARGLDLEVHAAAHAAAGAFLLGSLGDHGFRGDHQGGDQGRIPEAVRTTMAGSRMSMAIVSPNSPVGAVSP